MRIPLRPGLILMLVGLLPASGASASTQGAYQTGRDGAYRWSLERERAERASAEERARRARELWLAPPPPSAPHASVTDQGAPTTQAPQRTEAPVLQARVEEPSPAPGSASGPASAQPDERAADDPAWTDALAVRAGAFRTLWVRAWPRAEVEHAAVSERPEPLAFWTQRAWEQAARWEPPPRTLAQSASTPEPVMAAVPGSTREEAPSAPAEPVPRRHRPDAREQLGSTAAIAQTKPARKQPSRSARARPRPTDATRIKRSDSRPVLETRTAAVASAPTHEKRVAISEPIPRRGRGTATIQARSARKKRMSTTAPLPKHPTRVEARTVTPKRVAETRILAPKRVARSTPSQTGRATRRADRSPRRVPTLRRPRIDPPQTALRRPRIDPPRTARLPEALESWRRRSRQLARAELEQLRKNMRAFEAFQPIPASSPGKTSLAIPARWLTSNLQTSRLLAVSAPPPERHHHHEGGDGWCHESHRGEEEIHVYRSCDERGCEVEEVVVWRLE